MSDLHKQTWGDWLKAKFAEHICGPAPTSKCPLKAPWPPGQQCRVVQHPLHGNMLQLRDGARLPAELYTGYMVPSSDPWLYDANGGHRVRSVN